MPVETAENLEITYSKYLDPAVADTTDFYNALDEVMPRIYMMGFWRDMLTTLDVLLSVAPDALTDLGGGYYTLPADDTDGPTPGVGYDSIVAATLAGSPVVVYSMWHDYMLFGQPSSASITAGTTSNMAGVFDDGYKGVDTAGVSDGRRRYRISPANPASASFLVKRKYVPVDASGDNVYIPNDATILKHALLGKLAEDNADLQRAEYHWQTAQKLIDTDLDSYMGGARPNIHINTRPIRYAAPTQEAPTQEAPAQE